MATVQIPPVLRAAVGGERVIQADGETLGTLLDNLYDRYPALREQLQPGADRLEYAQIVLVHDTEYRTGGPDVAGSSLGTLLWWPSRSTIAPSEAATTDGPRVSRPS